MFEDKNTSSPLYGARGTYRLNNKTVEIMRPDFPSSSNPSYGSSSGSYSGSTPSYSGSSPSYGSNSSYSGSSPSYGSSGGSYGGSYGGSSYTPYKPRCYDIWGNDYSTYTNSSSVTYNSSEYYLANYLPWNESSICCYSDAPVVVDIFKKAVTVGLRYGDCEACGKEKGLVELN